MSKLSIIGLAFLVAFLVGCTAKRAYDPNRYNGAKIVHPNKVARIAWPEKEYQALENKSLSGKTQTYTLSGELLFKSNQGKILEDVTAGIEVYLSPVTSYSTQFFDVLVKQVGGPNSLEEADPRIFKYVKETVSGRHGAFSFENIPSGDYYLYYLTSSETKKHYPYMVERTILNGLVGKKITIHKDTQVVLKNTTTRCVLSGANQPEHIGYWSCVYSQ